MKKADQKRLIQKRCYEYAKSGEFSDWLSIEFKLESEGLYLAREELDRPYLREQLDDLCRFAQSDEEVERRRQFKSWINAALESKDSILQGSELITFISDRDDGLYASCDECSVILRRKFRQNKLEYSLSFKASDGQRYRFGFEDLEDNRDFIQINVNDLTKILNSLINKAKVSGKHF